MHIYLNFKRSKPKVLACLFVLSVFASLFATTKPLLKELLEDFKRYKTTSMHRGDLFEHSIWAEQYVSGWANSSDNEGSHRSCWLKDFSERQKYVVAVAALLHDIGKAGDPEHKEMTSRGDCFYYFSKQDHERIGFDYVLHDIKNSKKYVGYKKTDGKYINLKSILDELNLSADEQKQLAVLVGMHKLFGLVFIHKTTEIEIVRQFKCLSNEAEIQPDKDLLQMAGAVAMADAYSTYFPVKKEVSSLVLDEFLKCEAPHPFKNDKARATKIIQCACSEMPKLQEKLFNELEKA